VAFKDSAKRIFISVQAGLAFGFLIALLIAPSVLEWFATPAIPTVCSCNEQIAWALGRLRSTLIISALIAALVAVTVVEIVRVVRGKKDVGVI
jgi:hypothetical protein